MKDDTVFTWSLAFFMICAGIVVLILGVCTIINTIKGVPIFQQ